MASSARGGGGGGGGPRSPWGVTGVIEIDVEVETPEEGWVSVTRLPLEGNISRLVQLPSLSLDSPVVTLKSKEVYSIFVKRAPGEHRMLGVDATVDGISAMGAVQLPAEGLRFKGFVDKVTSALKPFVATEIEVVEGVSIKAQAAAQDAMDRAGKVCHFPPPVYAPHALTPTNPNSTWALHRLDHG